VPLRAQLDKLERVERRLCLGAGKELADGFLLALVAFLDRPLLRAGDQVERDVRRRRCAVHRVVDGRVCAAEDRLRVGPVGLGPLEHTVGELARECQ
jgi:hypothetical protein